MSLNDKPFMSKMKIIRRIIQHKVSKRTGKLKFLVEYTQGEDNAIRKMKLEKEKLLDKNPEILIEYLNGLVKLKN